jgi:glycosyltransferase involved in cell wall biosynthesis
MMPRPKVSVVLPCYNAEATLETALQSLFAQTLSDLEVVAVDDGSSDATGEILQSYAATDERLRPLSQPHRGIVSALNAGLGQARGEYTARMDADDAARPERLALQSRHLDEHPEVGLVACRVEFGGHPERQQGYRRYVEWTNRLLTAEEISLQRFVECPVAHPSIMFRAELVSRFGPYREGMFPEDYELVLRWLKEDVRMEKLPEKLLLWNDDPGRLSRNDPRCRIEAFYRIKAVYLAAWLERHNPHHPEVVVLGSKRKIRKRVMRLRERGVSVAAYVDVDPSRTHRSIGGIPVLALQDLPEPGSCFCLSFVAQREARQDVAAHLEDRGYRLGRDYLPAA